MDWYRSVFDDLVVPREQESSDRLKSPDIWPKWGIYSPENCGSPNQYYVTDTGSAHEEFNYNDEILCDMIETSAHDKDRSSGSSSVCGGFSEESFQQASFSRAQQADDQLDDLEGIEQMDDIFLSSLLDDLPGSENFEKPCCFSPDLQSRVMPADNISRDMILDSQSTLSNIQTLGSSRYLKAHAFSPSVNLEKGVTTLHVTSTMLEQRDCPPMKELLNEVPFPSEQNSTNGHEEEEISLEESVLQDLEMVMAQLTDKTRICFRDAFYRLANNSKQQVVMQRQNKVALDTQTPSWTEQNKEIRSGRQKAGESETNTIDRAIANLMFDKMDFNLPQFSNETSTKSEKEVVKATEPVKLRSNGNLVSRTDVEVPVIQTSQSHKR